MNSLTNCDTKNKSIFKSLILFSKGESFPKLYTISLILNLGLLFLFIMISVSLYEGGFRLLEHQISHLDNINHNPLGLWFFKLGFIIAGVWFVPNAIFITKNMIKFNKILGIITGFFYIMAGFGLIIVASFPTRINYTMHVVGAVWGFGSLIFAIFFSTILIILKLIKEFNSKTLLYTLVFYTPLFLIVIFGIIYAGIPLIESLQAGVPFGDFEPDDWEFYEWGMFFAGLYSTLGSHLIFLKKE